MPFVYREVDQLWHKPLAGSGTCVDIHAAIVLKVMGSGIWVMDQWKGDERRPHIERRLIRVPAPHKQRNADGTFMTPSDNALAFYVIER